MLSKLEDLGRKMLNNNNIDNLNKMISSLKQEYTTYFNEKRFNDLFNKAPKGQDISPVQATKRSFGILEFAYLHHYFYILLEEAIQKINQQPNNTLGKKAYQ